MCLITCLSLIIYSVYYYYKYSKRKNPLPGPLPLPFIGNLYQFGFLKDDKEISNKFIQELFSNYGDIFETYSFNERIIWINRIDLAEKFLCDNIINDNNNNNNNKNNENLEYNYFYLRNKNEIKELRMNEMGIYSNHEYSSWKFNRNVLIKCVTLPTFLKEIVIELQEQFKELETYWNDIESVKSDSIKSDSNNQKSNFKNGSSISSINSTKKENNNNNMRNEDKIIDISKWIKCFTLDIFLQSITREKSFSMANYYNQIMKDDDENKLKGIEPILNKNDLFVNKFKNSLWLLNQFNFKLIGLPNFFKKFFLVYKLYYRKYFDDYWWFHESLLRIVQARRLEISNSPKEQDLKADMLTCLINSGLKTDDGRSTTDEEIVFMMKDYLSEGIGTISNTFSYIIYYICKYPTIKYRMIEEIDSLYNNQNDTFTYFILAKLYYCEAVIKEVSRIHSVYPLISRISNEKENIGGFTWDNGQMFCINLHAIHNHKYNWNNPEEFDPERFLYLEEKKAEEKELNEKDYIGNSFIRKNINIKDPLFSFGIGLRSCPAKNLAMIILKTMVVMFLRKYDVILMDKNSELQINYNNMLNNCEELKVKIRPRHNNNQ